MSRATGRYIPVSYFRRLVTDLMHSGARVPGGTVAVRMAFARLIAGRLECRPPPTWPAIFVKAFALVGGRWPLLGTSCLTLPWPRSYERVTKIATLNVEREREDEPL